MIGASDSEHFIRRAQSNCGLCRKRHSVARYYGCLCVQRQTAGWHRVPQSSLLWSVTSWLQPCHGKYKPMPWKISPPFPSFPMSKVPITVISAAYWMLTLNLDIRRRESVYWRQMWKARISLVCLGLLGRSQLLTEALPPKWLNLSSLHNLCYVRNVPTGLYAVSLVLSWGVVFLEGLGTLGGGTPLTEICIREECAHRLYVADSLLLSASCQL